MNAIEIKNLSKSYPGFQLEDINLTLPGGCILGLLGENGAGKSTLIRLILDLCAKSEGQISVLGENHGDRFHVIKQDVGVVCNDIALPYYMNVARVNNVMKHSFRNWDESEFRRLTELFELPEKTNILKYSTGMKMRLQIAVALSHKAKLLIMDEPTEGLDPVARNRLMDLIVDFVSDEEHSALISSHIVSDLEKVCDYVGILHKGKLRLVEEKDRLLDRYGMLRCPISEQERYLSAKTLLRRDSACGVEMIVERESVAPDVPLTSVGLEELFVAMIEGGNSQ